MLTQAKVIRGTLVPMGRQPDGDSIRFRADKPSLFPDIYRGYKIKPAADGTVQLRLQGIGSPETHFGGHGQPLGDKARDALFGFLGFKQVKVQGNSVTDCEPDTCCAAILTSGGDPHGQPICHLLPAAAAAGLNDGRALRVSQQLLRQTVNFAQVERGMAYPLFYESMAPSHFKVFREAAIGAERHNRGIWFHDRTAEFLLDRQADASDVPGWEADFPEALSAGDGLFAREWRLGGRGEFEAVAGQDGGRERRSTGCRG